ncbi:MAG TPA: hypothetical protein VKE27_03085 [Candidatus Dormibacteraeota bacterium]|nr:hypothetical protein [Candidatus Dormibacteraeota bacterium]
MPAIRPRRSPAGDLPGRYLATGLVAFLLFAVGVPFLAPELVRTNDDPRVFALTHIAVLGWLTMTMFGALYQLFPVALGGTVRGPRLGRWNYWVLTLGIAGFVPSFYFNWTWGVAIFGSLVVGGVLHFASQMLRSYPSVTDWHPMAFYVLAALVWLVLTVGLGSIYALNWRFTWFEVGDPMLAAHVHLGLAGWLGLTLMGVSYKLTELFSLAHGHGRKLTFANLGLWNVGLVGLAASLWFAPGTGLVVLFAVILAASAVLHVVDIAFLLRTRRRRKPGIEQWHMMASLASLLIAAALGLLIVSGHTPGRSWVVAYGYAALAGWFGFAIVGKSYKILPFLNWLHRYSGTVGERPVPLLRDLFDERLAWVSFALLLAGFSGVLAGLLLAAAGAVEVAGAMYVAGGLVFVSNVARLALPLALSRRREVKTQEMTA